MGLKAFGRVYGGVLHEHFTSFNPIGSSTYGGRGAIRWGDPGVFIVRLGLGFVRDLDTPVGG